LGRAPGAGTVGTHLGGGLGVPHIAAGTSATRLGGLGGAHIGAGLSRTRASTGLALDFGRSTRPHFAHRFDHLRYKRLRSMPIPDDCLPPLDHLQPRHWPNCS
jgi:hypothetical protein